MQEQPLKADDVKYSTFLEICRTAYHETRHGEQFYRIAPALALGALAFPDKGGAELMNRAGVGGGVAAKVAALTATRRGAGFTVASMDPGRRASLIAELLDIPQEVAQEAEQMKAGFKVFGN